MIERKGNIPNRTFRQLVRPPAATVDRDRLARYLYVVEPCGPDVDLTIAEQAAGAQEWDEGKAKPEDVAACYAQADRMIANWTEPNPPGGS